jgi:putative PIN family toxin of toxin-antitoxin system
MQQHVSLRLVVDANVWVSYLLTRSFGKLNELITGPPFQLLRSDALMVELTDVLDRPRLRRQLDPSDVMELLELITRSSRFVEVTSHVDLCRDPDDNHLLALCKDGKADLLITGDKDLLVLKKFGKTRVLAPAEFLRSQR